MPQDSRGIFSENLFFPSRQWQFFKLTKLGYYGLRGLVMSGY